MNRILDVFKNCNIIVVNIFSVNERVVRLAVSLKVI